MKPSERRSGPARVLTLLCALLGAAHASAGQYPLWEIGAGAFPMRLPDYRGSNESRNYLLPFPYIVYRGEWLQVDRRGATGILFERGRVELDLSASAQNPARSDRNRAREGMPDLDPAVELGPRLKVTLLENGERSQALRFELPVRAVFGIDFPRTQLIGTIINPTLNYDFRNFAGSGWNVGAQLGPVFGDRRYHRYYYEVAPEFARADRPTYGARGGYSGMQYTVGASRRWGRMWLGGFLRVYDLSGAAFEDSPLVKTRTAVLAGFGLAYIFAESAIRVEASE